ncbi:MAG: hypothetical protein ABI647_21950 [Gemmatimonadota bacterium]
MKRLAVVLALALAVVSSGAAQKKKPVARVLSTSSLSGQSVVVLPITIVVAEPGLKTGALPSGHSALVAWADSVISEALQSRAADVKWKLPPEIRRVAKRGAGFVQEPDFMGQSVLRGWSVEMVPDPLRSHLRRLSAVVGDRLVLVPASIFFRTMPNDSVHVELSVALVDSRLGRVIWRTFTTADADSPTAALEHALTDMLPMEGSGE